MLVILFYDITDTNKQLYRQVKKISERYLYRVQYSVFEGELLESKLQKLIKEIEDVFDKYENSGDSLLIYTFPNPNIANKIVIGDSREDIFFT
jgi:CRISPR-associated endonuclease Cas2